ncbi:single-stranded DNA-binding protein [Shewanella oncorhynchi]|uniref:single-stranded DNA-binding protein n=1 Tax=Shewanella TaxID=22 RepID=UPI0039AF9901
MGSVNKVILVGNIGKDIDFRVLDNGSVVANFSVATSDSWRDQAGVQQEVTDWHKVVVWGKLAEIINQYGGKGRQIYIEGKQKTRKFKDASGQDRYSTEVVVDFDGKVQLLGVARENENQGTGYQQNAPQQRPQSDYQQNAPQQRPQSDYQQNAPQQRPQGDYQQNAPQQRPQGGYQKQPQTSYQQKAPQQNYQYPR